MEFRDKIKQLISKGATVIVISKNGLKADITNEINPLLLEFKILQDQYYESLTKNRELEQLIEVYKYNLEEKQLNNKELLNKKLENMIRDS
jgi:hypothetical protein